MKSTLTIDVEYDPDITDDESLAVALDRLMETALSTPDILDEYGNPRVGQFFVLPAATAPPGANAAPAEDPSHRSLIAMCERVAGTADSWGECSDMREALAVFREVGQECRELLSGIGQPCACEEPGHFCSGISGILAHFENGSLAPGAKVERCGQCERYPSDAAAWAKLVEMGLVPKSYALELDGPLFRTQRGLLLRLHHAAGQGESVNLGPKEHELLEGLLGLTDAIADQAADRDEIDCLIPEQE